MYFSPSIMKFIFINNEDIILRCSALTCVLIAMTGHKKDPNRGEMKKSELQLSAQ